MFENIYGDSGRYMQCLLNFLSNAIKFSQPEKTIIIRLTLLEAHKIEEDIENMDLRKKKDYEYYSKIQIDIEDNGIGISQENINKLFIDFGKLNDDEGMNLQGTGLGLSICKRIIEQMGGQVFVRS